MNRIRASDYSEIARVSDPALAPDSEWVAFVRTIPRTARDYEATIYRVPLGGNAATPFTAARGVDAAPRFSPEGDRLAFVSSRGDDESSDDLWVLPTDGGEARQVTSVVDDVTAPVWSPDGRHIAFRQRSTPDERDAGLDRDLDQWTGDDPYQREPPDPRVIDRLVYRSEEEYFDGTRSHIYCLDLETASVDRVTGGAYDFVAPEWGDASTLYYAANRSAEPDDTIEYDIIAHNLETDHSEVVTRTTAWTIALAATTDGRIAFPFHPAERASLRSTELRIFDRDTDETTDSTAGIDRTVDPEIGLEWDPSGTDLYFATPDAGSVVLRRFSWPRQAVETVIDGGHLDGFSVGSDAVAYTQSEWDHPGDVFVATRGGGERNRLTRVNASYLDDRAVSQPEALTFDSDGHPIEGWLLLPPDAEPGDTVPLVVEVHGGPHAMWSTAGSMWHEFQTMAGNGYAVFWSNPRGSTGYGEGHRSAIESAWGPVTMADIEAGIDHVVDRSIIDSDAIYLTGGSFGGFMVGWILGRTDRFRAAVAQRGVYDLIGFYGATDKAFKLVEWDFGTSPLEDAAALWDHSPVAAASDVTTPVLLLHAENDYRVPINDAELYYRLLRKRGVDVRLVRYPREGHELSRSGEPGHIVDRLERITRWFDDHAPPSDHESELGSGSGGPPS